MSDLTKLVSGAVMKRLAATILIAIFLMTGSSFVSDTYMTVVAQKKDKPRKDQPGPPVVKDKGGKSEKPKGPPPKKKGD
jgi:hypothetical protein